MEKNRNYKKMKMPNSLTNKERTEEYLKKFDREKVLKFLVKDNYPVILNVGANTGAND